MSETEETPEQEIGQTEREADQQIGELEHEGKEMEERLEAVGDRAGDVDVEKPAEASEPGVDETDVPEGEGESAEEAGQ